MPVTVVSGLGCSQVSGTQARSLRRVAGAQVLGLAPKPPGVHIIRNLGLKAESGRSDLGCVISFCKNNSNNKNKNTFI